MSDIIKFPILLFITLFVSFNSLAIGQDSSAMLKEEMQEKVLKKIGQLLRDNYVLEDVGQACAEFLEEQIEDENYADITHPREFARKITSDLREIHNDQHIRIQTIPPEDKRIEKNVKLDFFLQTRGIIKANMGFKEVTIMDGNVGYINLHSFEPYELAWDKALIALHFVENSDAIIIDLRSNVGGNPTMVQFMCSYFFDQPVHLNNIYWRRGDYTEEFWSMDSIGINKRPDVPVFILTSSKTFSAGEEFANDLKTTKRATLIGEKTAGGANPGYTFSINKSFNIFIPTGRYINPVTKTNWEGTGVEPDIKVRQSKALSTALEKAKQTARIYREKTDDQAVMSYLQLCSEFDMMDTLFAAGDQDSAFSIIKNALKHAVNSDLLNEWMINDLGYRYLSKKELSSAQAIFQFNVSQYPHSFNVYDSLGEAYMESGDNDLAIANYMKSLKINPKNENARYMLDKLRARE
jgi:C-terminal processing protease CtpA/Prc